MLGLYTEGYAHQVLHKLSIQHQCWPQLSLSKTRCACKFTDLPGFSNDDYYATLKILTDRNQQSRIHCTLGEKETHNMRTNTSRVRLCGTSGQHLAHARELVEVDAQEAILPCMQHQHTFLSHTCQKAYKSEATQDIDLHTDTLHAATHISSHKSETKLNHHTTGHNHKRLYTHKHKHRPMF